jgi:hypothetical protein
MRGPSRQLARGEPAVGSRARVDKLAGDVTLEGVDARRRPAGPVRHSRRHRRRPRSCATARTSTSPARGDNGFIEDYTAEVRGTPLGCLHLVTFNADGQAQHIAAHYRPLSSLMFFSDCYARGSPPLITPSASSPAGLERA